MHFKITSEGNNSTFGDLFFSLPTEEESNAAAQQIAQLCRRAVPDIPRYQQRLEDELRQMQACHGAYYFLILQKIRALSPDTFLLHGSAVGSIISNLLGLTKVDMQDPILLVNHLSTPVEFIWGLPGEAKLPAFEACIDPSIRPLLHSHLDSCFSRVKTDDNLFCRISLPDRVSPTQGDEDVADPVSGALHTAAKQTAEHFSELLAENSIDETQYKNMLSLTEEILLLKAWDLPTYIRLYAYMVGSFSVKRQVANLHDPWFFTTREEFYAILSALGMPAAKALDMVKYGVWSSGEKRRRYTALLEKYGAPQPLLDTFAQTTNIWSAAGTFRDIDHLL